MNSPLRISLRAGERIFLNGAIVRVNSKVMLELLNDITFILEQHVIREEEAITPLRQLYLIVQMVFLVPAKKDSSIDLCRRYIAVLLNSMRNEQMVLALKNIEFLVASGRFFEALKTIRTLYLIESMEPSGDAIFASIFQCIRQEIESWKLIQK
ncbi:flagellar biosynthesis repressor FlbT [Candidatus Liberibacter solanacearum]|uniref:Flagellar basal-body rod modification protein FlgD n=2 Tax=Candidatus Liberibacter solanacearum TaxID=556287 RepID=A0A0F4VJF6_9HYPH|nr:flagellar biosynthesis repressor FlbT [Candidatus Liberibacter solanacearum]ADR52289.1 flagellar biosynthesis repressor FlbT [Candidatus Liberibacter solanacearum CLso-ZC1]KJZ81524.1 flagellum biosynthesis protein FlbT [Candidatus Liberibacter solanacearum]KJZ82424.1 Flagellar basal-body rod modification protein FlgD [Candidatus Liberibacter solanacearum]KQC49203.1 flagellum biosynthesis protein FlbT [Candidatus Liberibacter solanacearum]ONI58737.1 flagellar biosynthesis repressor FlbT [Can